MPGAISMNKGPSVSSMRAALVGSKDEMNPTRAIASPLEPGCFSAVLAEAIGAAYRDLVDVESIEDGRAVARVVIIARHVVGLVVQSHVQDDKPIPDSFRKYVSSTV